MVQRIAAIEACAAARKAYDEGRLLAQCTTSEPCAIPYGYEVNVAGTTYVCAIGACLTRESLNEIELNECQLMTLKCEVDYLENILSYLPVDYQLLVGLQTAHDHWLMTRIAGHNSEIIASAERKFLASIQAVLETDHE